MKTPQNHTLGFYEKEAWLYHHIHARPIQVYTARWEEDILRCHILPSSTCVDIGCGEGRTVRTLLRIGAAKVIGIDFSYNMLKEAQKFSQDSRAFFCRGEATRLPLADEVVDLAVTVTALNNVPNLNKALMEMARILRPGGKAIFFVINRLELSAIVRGIYYWPFYLWRSLTGGTPYERQLYSRQEIMRALPSNLKPVEVHGMRLLPDLLPEWPFNFFSCFFSTLRSTLNALRSWDQAICHHPILGRFARFHVVITTKG